MNSNFLKLLNKEISTLEIGDVEPVNNPIIFICGVPRSGTTLLYQLLSNSKNLSYVNNFIAKFWDNPVVGIKLYKELGLKNSSAELFSDLGRTRFCWEPHEFGYFWNRIFSLREDSCHNLNKSELDELKPQSIKDELYKIVNEFDSAVVFKNLIVGFQASYMQKLFKNAVFIRVERDLLDVYTSVFKARVKEFDDPKHFFSLKPEAFRCETPFKDDPYRQIISQVNSCNEELVNEFDKLQRCYTIRYDALCSDPQGEICRLSGWLARFGLKLEIDDVLFKSVKVLSENKCSIYRKFENVLETL